MAQPSPHRALPWLLALLCLLWGPALACDPAVVDREPDASTQDAQEPLSRDAPADRRAADAAPEKPTAEPASEGPKESPPEPSFPTTPKALILDHQLGARAHWIEVIDALQKAGYAVTHRRFYPHLTAADVDPKTRPYQLILLAASDVPNVPGSIMRFDELKNAQSFVESGGFLLLAPRSSKQDTRSGENEWFLFNRLLQLLGAGLRIEKTTVIGDAWVADPGKPKPPNVPSAHGYPSTLESVVGFPYLTTVSTHPTAIQGTVAGGSVPTLLVSADPVEILLQTSDLGYLWRNLTGDPAKRIEALAVKRAVAALAAAKRGFVSVVGKGILSSLGGISGASSDKPSMDHDALARNRAFLQKLFAHALALQKGQRSFKANNQGEKDELFRVKSRNVDELPGAGPIYGIFSFINKSPVPAKPPAGDLDEPAPDGKAPKTQIPSWMSKGKARIAYGDLTKKLDDMKIAFGEIKAAGIDAKLTNVNMERIHDPKAQANIKNIISTAAKMAQDAGVRWILSGFWHTYFVEKGTSVYPGMIGAQGQDFGGISPRKAPAPIHEEFWSKEIIPVYEEVGKLAKAQPGVFGMSFDLELYIGPLWHVDGYAFSDSTTNAFLAKAKDQLTDEQLKAFSGKVKTQRFTYLLDQGLAKLYFQTLEAIAQDLGRRCREAAHKHAPDLQLFIYIPVFPSSWFYRGLLRGLGTANKPVVVLSFDSWGQRAQELLQAQGVHMLHLGGGQVSHYKPEDFTKVLTALTQGNQGYWYLSFNDFSKTNPSPPALHGKGEQYWSAVEAAHKAMAP